jgi:hypothetical protein
MVGTRAVIEKDLTGKIPGAVEVKGLSREEVLGEGGLLKQLTGRLLSRILEVETGGHSGCEKNSNAGDNSGDSRWNRLFSGPAFPRKRYRRWPHSLINIEKWKTRQAFPLPTLHLKNGV